MDKLVAIVENGAGPGPEFRQWNEMSDIELVFLGSGIEAILWLGKGNIPDLILAEADMGFMPGEQFIQNVKRNGFFKDIPVVAFGDPSSHPRLAEMVQAGADDVLIRPFGSEEINDIMGRFLPQTAAI
jgi:CheY-like chemotaxis protein